MREVQMTSAIERFEQAAIDHGKYMKTGNSAACNRAYDKGRQALRELRIQPDRGQTALLGLLNHDDDSVRVWAATDLLSLNSELAIPVLERIAAGAGVVAFDALMVLKEWRAGRLKVD
jgi:hypothetical protein